MDTYQYKGRNKRGEILQGMIESHSPQAVATWMMDAGISPIAINAHKQDIEDQPEWLTSLLGEGKVTQVELLMFTRQMGTMVRAGMPMMQALEGIQKSTGSTSLVRVLKAIRGDLDKGAELSLALSHHPKVFDEYYVNMIRVGENSGRLEEAFKSLFDQIEFDKNMKQKIKSALRYPTFVLTAIAIAISILTIFVIPVFAKTYAGLKVELPLLTRVLIGVSNFAVHYWWVVLAMIALVFYMFRLFLSTPDGRYRWDKFKLRIPIIGKVIVKGTIGRFCRSFATASKSGVPIVQAFQLVARVVDNAFYEERIMQMREGVERGESLRRVAQSAGIFSPLELQMISVGEETGDVDGMIEQIALMYQEDVEYEVDKLSESIEPILLAVMGVLVMILLLGIFMPLWNLGQATFQHYKH